MLMERGNLHAGHINIGNIVYINTLMRYGKIYAVSPKQQFIVQYRDVNSLCIATFHQMELILSDIKCKSCNGEFDPTTGHAFNLNEVACEDCMVAFNIWRKDGIKSESTTGIAQISVPIECPKDNELYDPRIETAPRHRSTRGGRNTYLDDRHRHSHSRFR